MLCNIASLQCMYVGAVCLCIYHYDFSLLCYVIGLPLQCMYVGAVCLCICHYDFSLLCYVLWHLLQCCDVYMSSSKHSFTVFFFFHYDCYS